MSCCKSIVTPVLCLVPCFRTNGMLKVRAYRGRLGKLCKPKASGGKVGLNSITQLQLRYCWPKLEISLILDAGIIHWPGCDSFQLEVVNLNAAVRVDYRHGDSTAKSRLNTSSIASWSHHWHSLAAVTSRARERMRASKFADRRRR